MGPVTTPDQSVGMDTWPHKTHRGTLGAIGFQTEGWLVTSRQSWLQATLVAMRISEDLVEYLGAWKDPVYFLDRLIDVWARRS